MKKKKLKKLLRETESRLDQEAAEVDRMAADALRMQKLIWKLRSNVVPLLAVNEEIGITYEGWVDHAINLLGQLKQYRHDTAEAAVPKTYSIDYNLPPLRPTLTDEAGTIHG